MNLPLHKSYHNSQLRVNQIDDTLIVMNTHEIAKYLVSGNKGILAADESTGSIKKRFDSIGVASTVENHRIYRQMLFTTSGIEKFVSGVIMFDETLRQETDGGITFPNYLVDKGILPGIKVDKGLIPMANFPGDTVTEGLDGLRDRLSEYKKLGAKFAKWRAAFKISGKTPSQTAIDSNSELLARYAVYCQEFDIVPIVEPEVLMDGTHTIEKSNEINLKVLKSVFLYLAKHKVDIKGMILKASWVHPGLDLKGDADSKIVAKNTLDVFKKTLPDELPGVVFLSGGDTPEDSTSHLDKLNELNSSWPLSFSFGRALQEPALKTWAGKKENMAKAQEVFYERVRLNSLARTGEY